MAIKVNGTTVIDDSRNLSNIAGGLKTVNSTSLLGSGNIEAGASTTYGAVGTYIGAYPNTTGSVSAGSTTSGSNLRYWNQNGGSNQFYNFISNSSLSSAGLSGTWRAMAPSWGNSSGYQASTLYVRIS